MRETITLTVSPVGYSTRGRLFDGHVDGRAIVGRSAQPLLDGARALLGECADPTTKLGMRHVGQGHDALRSTVGVAAGLTVTDATNGKPALRRWKASPHVAEKPPMLETDVPATGVAPLLEAA